MSARLAHINALTHAFGHVSDGLSSEERRFFLAHLDELRASRTTLATTLTLLRAWTLRFDVPWLAAQAYFRPYPLELQQDEDEGEGEDEDEDEGRPSSPSSSPSSSGYAAGRVTGFT